MKVRLSGTLLIFVMLITALVPGAGAAPSAPPVDEVPNIAAHTDNPYHPLGAQQSADREMAFAAQMNGKTNGRTHQIRRHHYVELDRLGEDTIWTILGQFGDQVNPSYGGSAGPAHNQIPKPDRKVDNTTIWTKDFSRPYFEKLLFSEKKGDISMRNFYIEQSSNRYAVNGAVTDWVQLPYNEANYGSNYCGDIVCARTWLFVRDAASAWYNAQLAAGQTPAQIDAYLAQFDVWDRYDYDLDGNFNEPDGYIDHFQAVHAGEGEETGGGAQGTDAIWSHRWYAFYNLIGAAGPAFNKYGGLQVGGSSYWIGDYTVEPENGGVGVFAHEFGHDLGLPDLYDTSGNTGGAEKSTGFWTLYSQGSYGSTGKPADGIGTKPIHMSAYEKIYLGWSNFTVVGYGQKATVKLGPAEFNSKNAQQLVVLLPDKQIDFPVGDPYAGAYQYFSGSGNDLDNSMSRSVALPAGAVSLSAKVKYDIEMDWDYAYVTVNGTLIHTNLSTSFDPNGQNPGEGITGSSGGAWVDLTADLSAYAGQTVDLAFHYWTDVAAAEAGMFIDEINITGQPTDGAETDPGWTYVGFSRVGSVVSQSFFNAYFAEYRRYVGYDDSLRTGPYNFGFLDNPALGNWVEHFRYQDGLLVWYYDESFADNNVGDNCLSGRCGGLFLPVDAHPDLLIRPDNGMVWRPRVQAFDSTFGLDRTDRICLNANSIKQCYPSLPAVPKFDDTKSYWVAPNPAIGNNGWASVPLPATGTTIRVVDISGHGDWMTVRVNK